MRAERITSEQVFNRWTVIKEREYRQRGHRVFSCKCACGAIKDIQLQSLRKGNSRSCGCLKSELAKRHGMWKSSEYTIWAHMHQRCTNPKGTGFNNYGGRGIRVCKRWADFKLFFEDMGLRPSKRHSIDRIDNDGDYTPKNCRWATASEQRLNKRPNVWERIVRLVLGNALADDLQGLIRLESTDAELAQHIARIYKP